MVVVKVAEHDVIDKVDTQYIAKQFSGIPNVGIIYVCTREGREEDGMRYIVIHLPYEEVRKSPDVRSLMLELAAK